MSAYLLRALLHNSRQVNFLGLGLIQLGKLRLDSPEFSGTENIQENLSEVPDKPIYDKVDGGVDQL